MDTLALTAWQRRRLQQQLRATHDARVYRRTLAVLEVARSEPVAAVARLLRVTPRAVYYWLGTYAHDHDPEALRDRDRPGRPSLLTSSDRLLVHLANCTGRRPWAETARRELARQGYTWKRSRYDLDPDPELGGKKAAAPLAHPALAAPQRRLGGG